MTDETSWAKAVEFQGFVGLLTAQETATELGTTPNNVRQLVRRGVLRPVRPGARPLMFRLLDVAELAYQRSSKAQRKRLRRHAEAAEVAFRETKCHDARGEVSPGPGAIAGPFACPEA